jgi:hypothetical protein
VLDLKALIEFLANLLGDDAAQAEFAQDPEGTLARAGLGDVTGQDVRDARLLMADNGSARAGDGVGPGPGGDDPVGEISYTARNFSATEGASGPTGGFDFGSLSFTNNFFSVDDRDTTFTDNSTTDVTFVQDSFNETDTTIDVTSINAEDSFNSTDASTNVITAIQDNDIEDNDVVLIDNDTVGVVEPAGAPEEPEAPEPEVPEPDPAPEPAASDETDDAPAEAADAAVL